MNWESDWIVWKDVGGIVVGLFDFIKRLGVFFNICGDRGEVLKWDDLDIVFVKIFVGEVAVMSSFAKKDKE